jgi:hypothetical protein
MDTRKDLLEFELLKGRGSSHKAIRVRNRSRQSRDFLSVPQINGSRNSRFIKVFCRIVRYVADQVVELYATLTAEPACVVHD